MTKVVNNSELRLFADDSCLFKIATNRNDASELLNQDLQRIWNWATQWLVTFSPKKTEAMLISSKRDKNQQPPLFLNGQVIKQVEQHKHLGIILSQDLKWSAHIDDLIDRTYKKLDLMRGLKFKLDKQSLETIYFSFIRSGMEYGDMLWTGTYENDLAKLDRIEIEALRIITGATARSNVNLTYSEVNWHPLRERRVNHSLIMMYKIINGLAPEYLANLMPGYIRDETQYNLRNRDSLRIPYARTETFRRSFLLHTVSLWNDLHPNIQHLPCLNSFKKALYDNAEPKMNFCIMEKDGLLFTMHVFELDAAN